MSIREELLLYTEDCVNDRISSGKKHKWACLRFIEDCKKETARNTLKDPWPYYWNEEEAEAIIDWFALLRHSKGDLAGQPITLTLWQKFNLCQLYGWRELKTGYKRFTQSSV